MDKETDRYEGCMLGLAIGDALGGPIEFLTYDEIRQRYPPDGVTDFMDYRGLKAGSYTDDTEMSIAVAQGLLRSGSTEIDDIMQHVAAEFVQWFNNTSILRSPGSTCMGAAARLAAGTHWRESGMNDSKGCGTAMRSAPIGLLFRHDLDAIVQVASASSQITHGHPAATAGAIGSAFMVARAVDGCDVMSSLPLLMKRTSGIHPDFTSRLAFLPGALALNSDQQAYSILGEGWVAEEALAGAIYAVAVAGNSFVRAVTGAANGGGDNDSRACIAGAIAGATTGRSGIPKKWVQEVESRQLLVSIAGDLSAPNKKLGNRPH